MVRAACRVHRAAGSVLPTISPALPRLRMAHGEACVVRDMAAVQTSWQTSARRALRQGSQHRHNLAALPSVHRVVTGRARRQRSHHARAGHTATPSRRRPAPARPCQGCAAGVQPPYRACTRGAGAGGGV